VHPWKGKWYLFTTFHDEAATLPATGSRKPYRRGTILAVADKVEGPYRVVRNGEPIAPKALMTLDGTLHVDAAGKPWLVYAHEWLQTTIGTIEANRACCSAPTRPDGRGGSASRMARPSG
jgi:hypothetical protein